MSERRIVIEEACRHGWLERHLVEDAADPHYLEDCPGGSRTVISEIPTEWVERAKTQMLHYFDDELFLDLQADLEGIVDWDWLARATLESAIGVFGGGKEET